jgi:hypothetical protein
MYDLPCCCFSQVAQGAHTVWVDNFSKTLGRQLPDIAIGAWSKCLWTGIALRKCMDGLGVSLNLIGDADGNTIPANPDDPFVYAAAVEQMWIKYRPTLKYRETSMMVKWDVRCIPIKPALHLVTDDQYRSDLKARTTALDTMYPKEIVAENIGSLVGFARVMRMHYLDNKQHLAGQCQRYTVFNVDIKIYEMMIKVV